MNEQALAAQFWEQGYLILPGFFGDDLMADYQQRILNHFGERPEYAHDNEFLEKAATEVIPWFPQQAGQQAFDTAQEDPRLRSLTEAILGPGWYSLYCMTMFSRSGSRGQAWHQDCPPEQSHVFNLNRLVYSQDITPQIGGQTLVIPGSHRRGELTTGPVDEELEEQVELLPSRGTLVMLHGHCWHRVRPVQGRYRVSTNYRCCPAGTPENVTDVCVYRNMRYRFETSEVLEERPPS